MMRILCLHGYGTSGAILRSQLDAFIHRADASYEFVFLDGEYECQRAHGIGKFAQPPFRCFNQSFGPHAIQSSLDHLQDFIDDEGPFDGLLGFSQGGSLALAYLLQMAETMAANPGTPPTFSFAVFLSTIVAFSPDPDFCSHLITDLTPSDRGNVLAGFPRGATHNDYAALTGPPERAIFFSSLGKVLETSIVGGFIAPDTPLGLEALLHPTSVATNNEIDHLPRIMHPVITSPACRVPVPTVHVVGVLDDPLLVSMSKLMEGLCEVTLTRSLVHDGGHDVPRKPRDVQALWSAVEWATREAAKQVW